MSNISDLLDRRGEDVSIYRRSESGTDEFNVKLLTVIEFSEKFFEELHYFLCFTPFREVGFDVGPEHLKEAILEIALVPLRVPGEEVIGFPGEPQPDLHPLNAVEAGQVRSLVEASVLIAAEPVPAEPSEEVPVPLPHLKIALRRVIARINRPLNKIHTLYIHIYPHPSLDTFGDIFKYFVGDKFILGDTQLYLGEETDAKIHDVRSKSDVGRIDERNERAKTRLNTRDCETNNLRILKTQKLTSKVTLTCEYCGRVFKVKPSLSKGRRYCSRKCYTEALKGKPLPKNTLKRLSEHLAQVRNKRIIKICPQCGNKFDVKPSAAHRRKFCSRKCHGENRQGKPLPPEWRENLSKAKKGKINIGRKHPDNSERLKRLHKDPEMRKIILANLERGRMINKEKFLNDPEFRKRTLELLAYYRSDAETRKKIVKAIIKKPNKKEQILLNIIEKHNMPFKYVGDGKVIIGNRCPDYISNDGKKIIELFGDYWHSPLLRPDLPWRYTYEGTLKHYHKHGYDVLIIWEKELKQEHSVIEKIMAFLNH